MLEDNEFEKIENFLKLQENPKMQVLQKFEIEVTQYITNNFNFSGDTAKADFLMLHEALQESYEDFIREKEQALRNFSISLVLVKNTLEKLRDIQDNFSLNQEEKKIYIDLMKTLVNALKEECNSNINYFNTFIKYVDNSIIPINTED